jgi:hypothetical protein
MMKRSKMKHTETPVSKKENTDTTGQNPLKFNSERFLLYLHPLLPFFHSFLHTTPESWLMVATTVK